MFEYRIQRNGSSISLSPKEIEDILVMNTAREALARRLMGNTKMPTEEMTLLCRHLYNMTPTAVIDNSKMLSKVISLTGNGTPAESDLWDIYAAKVLEEKASCTYDKNRNKMTLMAVPDTGKKSDDKLRTLDKLLEKFLPADAELETVSYAISEELTLYGLVNRSFAKALTSDPGWKDTLDNWMTDILSGDISKPIVLHMHGGEIYILRGEKLPLR